MRLPWDKSYIKISFHIIVTLAAVYLCIMLFTNFIAIVSLVIKLFALFFDILSPLWVGLIIAYLLDPLVDLFQQKYNRFLEKNYLKLKKAFHLKNTKSTSRLFGTIISYVVIIFIVVLIICIISFGFLNTPSDTTNIDRAISRVVAFSDRILGFVNYFLNSFNPFGIFTGVENAIQQLMEAISQWSQDLTEGLVQNIYKTSEFILDLFLGIVIAFYFLKDKNIFLGKLIEIALILLPTKINSFFKVVFEDLDAVFSGYIRAQIIDGFIMAILITFSLTLIQIDFAFIIGIISGFSNIMPYVGAIIGLVLACIMGLLSDEPIRALYALIVMIAVQQIDSIFIIPKVVGKQVDLSPVLVIIALSVGGALFGLKGMILAVPICAVIKIFFLRYLDRKRLAGKLKNI